MGPVIANSHICFNVCGRLRRLQRSTQTCLQGPVTTIRLLCGGTIFHFFSMKKTITTTISLLKKDQTLNGSPQKHVGANPEAASEATIFCLVLLSCNLTPPSFFNPQVPIFRFNLNKSDSLQVAGGSILRNIRQLNYDMSSTLTTDRTVTILKQVRLNYDRLFS